MERYGAAEEITHEVIAEYFDVLGITPTQVIGRNAPALWSLVRKTASVHEDVKHLADSLELCAMTVNKQGRDSGLLRIHSVKFYDMAGAIDSLVRVGQDLVDEFVGRGDFQRARDVIEKNVLPYVIAHNMIDRIVAVRSQYAVILAYCGEHDAADAEMARLLPYAGGFSKQQRAEIDNQSGFIAQLRLGLRLPANAKSPGIRKVGRNEPCPCGFGLKYKKCHG